MKHVGFKNVDITDGFWHKRQLINKNVTVRAIQDRFTETNRFSAWDFTDKEKPIPGAFYDSDVAKWIEGAANVLLKERNEDLELFIDRLVDLIEENRREDGYFNSHFLRKPDLIWQIRNDHELYCAGHMMEAAIAYYNATGKDKYLKLMEDYAQYINKVFLVEQSAAFKTPGHEEIELALVKMYHTTGKKLYLDMSKHFIDSRGAVGDKQIHELYNLRNTQDHLPVREQTTAEGHSVRALYLYSAMADIAREYDDEALRNACETLFTNITQKRMYITGGMGSSSYSEAFTIDYDLPNSKAYAETCAAIAMAFFAGRMTLLDADSKYADAVERVIYNGMLSGISLDGKSFFYENPLEIMPDLNKRNVSTTLVERVPITQRREVFSCSCCPPNLLRIIADMGSYIYSLDKDTLFVHQYMSSNMQLDNIKAQMSTNYPFSGTVMIKTDGAKRIALRKPHWCSKMNVKVNGKDWSYTPDRGYIYIDLKGENDSVEIDMDMPVRFLRSNPKVHENSHKTAVMRGPLVYAAEGMDNDFPMNHILFNEEADYELLFNEQLDAYMLVLDIQIPKPIEELYTDKPFSYIDKKLTMIPFYAFANRGESEMRVWL